MNASGDWNGNRSGAEAYGEQGERSQVGRAYDRNHVETQTSGVAGSSYATARELGASESVSVRFKSTECFTF